ncbi:unnamed protein product [Paramecium primaurelia]|uniref:Transmembrane protein n=1 Tax=Paramecium primaurelia TaxID=5886 RepID=A0A8S1NIU4_PARPR|nr:unnamed protein product [Paramecium primaurelia]
MMRGRKRTQTIHIIDNQVVSQKQKEIQFFIFIVWNIHYKSNKNTQTIQNRIFYFSLTIFKYVYIGYMFVNQLKMSNFSKNTYCFPTLKNYIFYEIIINKVQMNSQKIKYSVILLDFSMFLQNGHHFIHPCRVIEFKEANQTWINLIIHINTYK